jgi:ribokinase
VLVEGAARAAGAGLALVVNPAPARPLPPELVAQRPTVTPNAGEAAALTGRDDPADAAAALVESGAAAALVTAGPEGVFAAGEGVRMERFRPPVVSVLDTTGAGDTFSGVFAAGLARGWDLDRAARWATAAAALSVTRPGARGGMPAASEIEAVIAAS